MMHRLIMDLIWENELLYPNGQKDYRKYKFYTPAIRSAEEFHSLCHRVVAACRAIWSYYGIDTLNQNKNLGTRSDQIFSRI